MTDKELMQQALYALEYASDMTKPENMSGCECPICVTITALRDRLAQPEQEPLEYWNAVEGWVKIDEVRQHFDSVGCGTIYKSAGEDRVPIYTTPPQRPWVGLTDEEVSDLWCKVSNTDFVTVDTHEFARAVEAKLKEKNT